MRSFIVATAFFAALTSAASVPGLPSCAGSCVSTDFGGCGGLNVTCICSNKPLIDNLACCVSKQCNQADQESTISFANALCQGNGVDDLPQSATCAAGAASTTAASSSGSSAATGSTASSVSSAIAGASSSAASGSTTRTSSSSGGVASSASATASAAASSASASASATAAGNAGSRIEVAALGLGALVFGALAAM